MATAKTTLAAVGAALVTGAAAVLVSTSKPAPAPAPSALTAQTSAVPAPSPAPPLSTASTSSAPTGTSLTASLPVVGPRKTTALATVSTTATVVPPSVTLPRPPVFGFISLGRPPVQQVPAALSAAIAASPAGIARWHGRVDTFWASMTSQFGVQCWGDAANSLNRGLVFCQLVPSTFPWRPVTWQ